MTKCEKIRKLEEQIKKLQEEISLLKFQNSPSNQSYKNNYEKQH